MDDFGLGHWLDQKRQWTSAHYAFRAASKHVSSSYFVLVPIYFTVAHKHFVEWAVLILSSPVDEALAQIEEE